MYDDWHVEQVFCYTSETSSNGVDSFVPYRMPFLPTGGIGIVVYHFRLIALCPATKTFTIVIGPDIIPGLAETPRDSNVLEWKDWGPSNTRCFFDLAISAGGFEFENESTANKIRHNRFLTTTDILDFNQLDIARDLARGEREGIVSEPSAFPSDSSGVSDLGVFFEPVVSTLPYRKVPHNIKPDLFSRFMLDEQIMTHGIAYNLEWNIRIYH
jgi:hypothetical protein